MEKGMGFHRFYVVFLYIRGVFSAITCLGMFMNHPLLGLLGVGESILTFITANKLSKMDEKGLGYNIGLQVIYVLSVSCTNAISSGGMGFIFGLLGALAISVPILIYYNNRSDMFGEPVSVADELARNIKRREQAGKSTNQINQSDQTSEYWRCPKCYRNNINTDKCWNCGEPRPIMENQQEPDADRTNQQKPGEAGFAARTNQCHINSANKTEIKETDWDCPTCGKHNIKFDNVCCNCGTKKPKTDKS